MENKNNDLENDHVNLIKTCLKITNNEDIQITLLSKGVSNMVYLINIIKEDKNEKLVAKIYLKSELLENLNSRNKENYISKILSDKKLGPKILFCNDNIRIEEYLTGRDIYCSELKDESLIKKIAYKLGKIHSLKIDSTINNNFIEEIFTNKSMIDTFYENLKPDIYEQMNDKEFIIEIKDLLKSKDDLFKLFDNFDKVLCHNDIWVGNIFLTKEDIFFVDFQMTSLNFRGYDIGKLLIEPMYVRDSSGRNYKLDKNNFPSIDDIKFFLHHYFISYMEDSSNINSIDFEKIINDFILEVEIGILMSGYYSCFLGIYLAREKNFGLDFLQFAKDGFYIYKLMREKLHL